MTEQTASALPPVVDQQTWQANGGTGTPSGKSIAEQTRVAYNLYQARGRAPWPVCGKNL